MSHSNGCLEMKPGLVKELQTPLSVEPSLLHLAHCYMLKVRKWRLPEPRQHAKDNCKSSCGDSGTKVD